MYQIEQQRDLKPQFSNLKNYQTVVRYFNYITSSPIESLSDETECKREIKLINNEVLDDEVDQIYKVLVANIDKVYVVSASKLIDKNAISNFNINIETGISHENFSNFNENKILLEMISSNKTKCFELNLEEAQSLLSNLKEIYKKIN